MPTYKKPKYKIGDIVVYKDKTCLSGSTQSHVQSKIISSYSLYELVDGEEDSWYYHTEQTKEDDDFDMLLESEIIDKLN